MSSPNTTHKTRYRRSKLDAYSHLVGQIPDREVAAMAGITPDGVRMYRQRHKIPAYSTVRKQRGARPPQRPQARSVTSGATRAFSVAVRDGQRDRQFIVLAADIVTAAQRAAAVSPGAEITRLEYLAETLAS